MFEELRRHIISGDMEDFAHYLFTSNSGIGKTTLAELLGQMFYEMRYMVFCYLIEVD